MVVMKKTGSELTYRTRCVWIDVEQKRFCWSKNEVKSGEYKFIELVGATIGERKSSRNLKAEETKFSVVSSNKSEPSIDIQVDDATTREAWVSAIREISMR